ncbi:Phloem protein 2-like protein, partial [Cynara cardunculus var. scolymus]
GGSVHKVDIFDFFNWNAKVSDVGLSRISPANQPHTIVISNGVGTPGYLDPLYLEMGLLTKESNVYSFGVVLFEVLCGRLCFEFIDSQWRTLVRLWKNSYKEKKLDEIIFQDMLQQMDPSSLETFSDIAYLCLHESLEGRPMTAHIVKELEIALESQETYEKPVDSEEPLAYEEMIKTLIPPLIYTSKEELNMLLSKGILFNGHWFSLNKKGEHIEMISAAESIRNLPLHDKLSSTYNSSESTCLYLEYTLEGEKDRSTSYVAYPREDGWLTAELYRFTSYRRKFDLKMQFGCHHTSDTLVVEGIEFRPLEKVIATSVEHEALEDEKVDMQPISDSDIYWEQKLPNDYEEIITSSKDAVQWTTKKELYFLLREGFLINNGGEWFSLAKNGKKCYMLPARAALVDSEWAWQSRPESRFGEVAFNPLKEIRITYENKFKTWSPQTKYASYLVYKLLENHSKFEAPVKVRDNRSPTVFWMIYLLCRQTPVIRPKVDQNTNSPLNIPTMRDLPQQRIDGWMEVKVWDFRTHYDWRHVDLTVYFPSSLDGLIVQGIQFRPY